MSRLLKSSRPLYLLALFQLVGGPAVLLAVMFFGRLSVERVAEHGLVTGITRTLASEEWQTASEQLLEHSAALPGTQRDKVPAKQKETKSKTWITELARAIALPVVTESGRQPWKRDDIFADTRPQAPPGPPPRMA